MLLPKDAANLPESGCQLGGWKVKDRLRHIFRRFGFDLVRYPLSSPLARTVKLLHHYKIDCVVDVGANSGGFATSLRQLGYEGRLISFEPLRDPYELLRQKAASDDQWQTLRVAIGDAKKEVQVNVSGNSALSSSILPMLQTHERAAPNSRYVGIESVQQDTLDSLLPELGVDLSSRTFLKVDVQGYEGSVLEGCTQLFEKGAFVGMQLELSLVALYEGGMGYRDALDFAAGHGMTLVGLDPVFSFEGAGPGEL